MIKPYLSLVVAGLLSLPVCLANAGTVEFDFSRFTEDQPLTEQHPNWVRNNSSVEDLITTEASSGKRLLRVQAGSGGIRTRRDLPNVDGEVSMLVEFCVMAGSFSFSFYSGHESEAARISAVRFDVTAQGELEIISKGGRVKVGRLEVGHWYRAILSVSLGGESIPASLKVWEIGKDSLVLDETGLIVGPSGKWPQPKKIAGISLMSTEDAGQGELLVQRIVIDSTNSLHESP